MEPLAYLNLLKDESVGTAPAPTVSHIRGKKGKKGKKGRKKRRAGHPYDSLYAQLPTNDTDPRAIVKACIAAVKDPQKSKDPALMLGCRVYSDPGASFTTIPLGAVKMDKSPIRLVADGGVPAASMTTFFTDDALAKMIQRKCLYWDPRAMKVNQNSIQYADSASYKSAMDTDSSLGVKVSAGYGPFSANAAYDSAHTSKEDEQFERKTAYGSKLYYAPIGVLQNTCLSPERFEVIKDLVTAEWQNIFWRMVDYQGKNATELEKNAAF